MKACIEFRCKACDKKFDSETKIMKHLLTKKHKKQEDENAIYSCAYCPYKGYNSFLKYLHERNKHKDKNKINNLEIEDCKKRINLLLIIFRNNNIDPNKYFNYKYYAVNIDTLNKIQFNDFYKELKNVKKINKL